LRKEIFEKKIGKSLREKKKLFTFAPRKTRKLIERLEGKVEKLKRQESFKIFSSFSCEKQKEVLVLHPL